METEPTLVRYVSRAKQERLMLPFRDTNCGYAMPQLSSWQLRLKRRRLILTFRSLDDRCQRVNLTLPTCSCLALTAAIGDDYSTYIRFCNTEASKETTTQPAFLRPRRQL